MKKIKVLEVNNIDLNGRRFNGYDMIKELDNKKFDIKQAVIIKRSNNSKVVEILNNQNKQLIHSILEGIEKEQSIHNIYSITTPSLLNLPEYKQADIIHFHMFHNTKLSIYSLIKIANEKKVILSLHDPWFLTGRCVHFLNCEKWKNGCTNCPNIKSMFPLNEDNCSQLWNLKKNVFNNINIDIVVSSDWMINLVKQSPILKTQTRIHKIPLAIDDKKFSSITYKDARKKLKIKDDEIVLFFRAQNEFKGTKYIVEALKKLELNRKITLITCDQKGLVDDLKDRYRIIDLGQIDDKKMICTMNACDIFLMPSIGESFGMMAIEAMACGKPVVVFNNSAMPSVTNAPECGYLVNDRDSEDLMKAIDHLINNEKERKIRGNLGRKIVKKDYTIEVYNKSLEKLYESVMKIKQIKNKEFKQEQRDEENEENLKKYLNELTLRVITNNKKIRQTLTFDIDKSKINKHKKIIYDDLNAQKILEDYLTKLEKISREEKIVIKKSNAFQRAMFFLIYNRTLLIKKIKNRVNRRK